MSVPLEGFAAELRIPATIRANARQPQKVNVNIVLSVTRFDPVRDMLFGEQEFNGARPVYRGTIGIDATWKEGYPAPLVMDESIVKLVDRRWPEYWQ